MSLSELRHRESIGRGSLDGTVISQARKFCNATSDAWTNLPEFEK
jgi:hypothetical protein